MRRNLKMAHPHPQAASAMVVLDTVTVRFGATVALDGISLDVRSGEITCLLGPSGSGKSTLLRVVAGIEQIDRGRVVLDGIPVAAPGVFLEPERRRVGMVFQDYALFPHLTVEANVAFGLRGENRSGTVRRVRELLERVGLSRYAASYPHALSGGERQRVALARALAPRPRVLLMDEPFSSLDPGLRERLRCDTLHLLRDTNTTTIIVTHDATEAVRVADRIALLRGGRLLQCAPPEELYRHPTTAFAAHFLGDVNELAGTCQNGRVNTALGSFAAPQLPEQTPARVCIRPQHLRMAGTPTPIKGRVLASEFLGEIERVLVNVDHLRAPVSVRLLGRTHLAPGDTVHLAVDPNDVVVVPDDGFSMDSAMRSEASR